MKAFEVFYSPTASGTFVRVNTPDMVSTSYTYQVSSGSPGYFIVLAVDLWGLAGAFSDVVAI